MTFNNILGTEFPIIQGGMANIATGEFAAAVSNAGGLGLIGAGGMSADMLREHIKICKKLTDKPFGVNIMLMNPDSDVMADIIIEEHVPIVTTGAGNPAKYMPKWKQAKIKVFPVVPAVVLAKRMEQLGADAIIAEGTESGGHVGEATAMSLIPQVVRAVNIPVIAAGGIACGEQALAAFALGAVAIQVGTCLLAAQECPIHENYKNAIINAQENDTLVTGRSTGVPVRILKNKMSREHIRLEKQGVDKLELEKFTLGSLRRAVFDGDVQNGSLMAGQSVGLVNEILPVRTIMENLMQSCQKRFAQLAEDTNATWK